MSEVACLALTLLYWWRCAESHDEVLGRFNYQSTISSRNLREALLHSFCTCIFIARGIRGLPADFRAGSWTVNRTIPLVTVGQTIVFNAGTGGLVRGVRLIVLQTA